MQKTLTCNRCGYTAGLVEDLSLELDCKLHKQAHDDDWNDGHNVTWDKQSRILSDYRTGTLS